MLVHADLTSASWCMLTSTSVIYLTDICRILLNIQRINFKTCILIYRFNTCIGLSTVRLRSANRYLKDSSEVKVETKAHRVPPCEVTETSQSTRLCRLLISLLLLSCSNYGHVHTVSEINGNFGRNSKIR